MPNHGTALNPGQRAEFLKTGIGALTLLSHDPNLDSTIADGWAKNGEAMLRGFVGLIIPPSSDLANGIVKTSVVVIGGGRTTDQMVEAAKNLEGKNRPSHVDSDIKQANMPAGHGRKRSVIVEWFQFDHDPTTEEVRSRCEEPGYGYSTYEDGLRFQEDHPDDQRERPHIVVPENPWCDSDGYPRALGLWGDDDGRELSLDYCCLDDGWGRCCVFARRKYI